MELNADVYLDGERIRSLKASLPEGIPFNRQLEQALLSLCRECRVPVPMWLTRNTREFAGCRMTVFHREQFPGEVWFDRMSVRLESES